MGSFSDTRPLRDGPLSIDLLNTRWGPAGHTTDWFDDADAVRFFVSKYGTEIKPGQVDATRQSLTEARSLVKDVLDSDGEFDAGTVVAVNAALAQAEVALSADGAGVTISDSDPVHAVSIEAVVDAIGVHNDRPDRIRQCEHDQCTLWFFDISKAGRRRWCSMDQCGNRAKAQRHYKRSSGR